MRAVNDWENNRTQPRSSIGALEEVLGVSLTDDGPEVLPPIVAEHRDDPRVMEIWALTKIPPRSREGLIASLLEQEDPARKRA